MRYLGGRLLSAIPSIVLAAFVAFTLTYYGPGDPVVTLLGERVTSDAQLERARAELGLDRPFILQFADYVGDAAQGDLGRSWIRQRPVTTLLATAVPITLQMSLAALALVIVIGIPTGIVSALKRNTLTDRLIVSTSVALWAIPPYVLAPMAMVLFVLRLGWLPLDVGWHGVFDMRTVLPLLVLAAGPLVYMIRHTRNAVTEVLDAPYVRVARTRGIPRRTLLWRHVLPNALTPLLSQAGIMVAAFIVGAIFVESIFAIPGFGGLIAGSVLQQDYPLLLGAVVTAVALVVGLNLLVDLLYPLIDPRVRLGVRE